VITLFVNYGREGKIPVLHKDGKEKSIEKYLAGFLLSGLISENIGNDVEDALEEILDNPKFQGENFDIREFEQELQQAFDNIFNKSPKGIVKTYGFSKLKMGGEGQFKLSALMEDDTADKILGTKRMQDFSYTRPNDFIKRTLTSDKIRQRTSEKQKSKTTSIEIIYSEEDEEVLWEKGSKLDKMWKAQIQPYRGQVTSIKKIDIDEYMGLKPSTYELTDKEKEDFINSHSNELTDEIRQLFIGLKSSNDALNNIINRIVLDTSEENAEDKKVLQEYLKIRSAVGESYKPRDVEKPNKRGIPAKPKVYSNEDTEMIEFIMGYNYIDYMLPKLEEALKNMVEKGSGSGLKVFDAMKNVKKRNSAFQAAVNKIDIYELINNREAIGQERFDRLFPNLSSVKLEENIKKDEKLKPYFDNPEKILEDYLPEDLFMYKADITIHKTEYTTKRKDTYKIEGSFTKLTDLRPVFRSSGDYTAEPYRKDGETLQIPGELSSISEKEVAIQNITSIRRKIQALKSSTSIEVV